MNISTLHSVLPRQFNLSTAVESENRFHCPDVAPSLLHFVVAIQPGLFMSHETIIFYHPLDGKAGLLSTQHHIPGLLLSVCVGQSKPLACSSMLAAREASQYC